MRKIITIIALAMTVTGAYAQTAMLTNTETFEANGPGHDLSTVLSTGVVDFANPKTDGINPSATVFQIIRKDNSKQNATASSLIIKVVDDVTWSGMDFSTGKTSLRLKVMASTANDYTLQLTLKNLADNDRTVSTPIDIIADATWHVYEIDLSDVILKNGEQPVGHYDFINFSFKQTVDPIVVGEELYIDDVELFDPNSLSSGVSIMTDLKVSPTSISDVVNFTTSSRINKVEVYSYTGQLVSEFTGRDIKHISMSGINSGLYILNIKSDLGVKAVKVIKQ